MPTPVGIARACLAADAAAALDEAVAAARRRSHAQTTSLHVVSALLSAPTFPLSPLRDALSMARCSSSFPQRMQLRALVLFFGVALDRLPAASSPPPEPPVSNSLMAAVKRSQANQRRNPDAFYKQLVETPSPPVKVELQQLVLAILDDPVVSRVLSDAGFRSSDVKMAVLRPRFPRAAATRSPPLFLCSFASADTFPSPFSAGRGCENYTRKIGGVLAGKRGRRRSPVLVGAGAGEAAAEFAACVLRREWAALPAGLRGLRIVSVEGEELLGRSWVGMVSEELVREGSPGVLVNVGDVKVLADDGLPSSGGAVAELTKLVEAHDGDKKVWVMGWSATYETYMKLLSRFPALDKDWDMQLLPITSSVVSGGGVGAGGLLPKPRSWMEPFVSFGGSSARNSTPSNDPNSLVSCCHQCKEKYEIEVDGVMKGGLSSKLHDHCQVEDDEVARSSRIMDLQKKWRSVCLSLHHDVLHHLPGTDKPMLVPLVSEPRNVNFETGLRVGASTCRKLHTDGARSIRDARTELGISSAPFVASVKTDLVLGTRMLASEPQGSKYFGGDMSSFNPGHCKDLFRSLAERVGRQVGAMSSISRAVSSCKSGSYRRLGARGGMWLCFLGPDIVAKKKAACALSELLFGSTGESFFSMDLAIHDHLILRGKTASDHIASMVGNTPSSVVFLENVDSADVLVQSSLSRAIRTGKFPDSHGREFSISNAIFVVTATASEGARKPPLCPNKEQTAFSEERVLASRKLQMKLQIQPLSEVSRCGSPSANVVVTCIDPHQGIKRPFLSSSHVIKRKFEDLEPPGDKNESRKRADRALESSILDLNMPVEEELVDTKSSRSSSSNSSSGSGSPCDASGQWLDELFELVDEVVQFEPIDLNGLAECMLRDIAGCFGDVMGSDSGSRFSLEIDMEAMEQIVAAAWLAEGKEALRGWIDGVLRQSFVEARRRRPASCPGGGATLVLRLVPCRGSVLEHHHPQGILLPSRIVLECLFQA